MLQVMDVHAFANGIKIERRFLLDLQMERYTAPGAPNLHEPVEEEWMLRTFVVNKPTRPVFLDVGAGVGYYSVLIKHHWPEARVLAFEPLPAHVAAFRATMSLNGISDDYQLCPIAIGTKDGAAPFYDVRYGSTLGKARADAQVLTVATRTLESVLEGQPPVHMLKMDIQGVEVEVLAGGRAPLSKGRVRHILVGTHAPKIHADAETLLRDAGFHITHNDPQPPMQPDGILVATHPLA